MITKNISDNGTKILPEITIDNIRKIRLYIKVKNTRQKRLFVTKSEDNLCNYRRIKLYLTRN